MIIKCFQFESYYYEKHENLLYEKGFIGNLSETNEEISLQYNENAVADLFAL